MPICLAGLAVRASTLVAEFESACPSPGSGTLEGNLATFADALLTLQRALLPLLASMIGKRELLRRFLAELHSAEIGGPDRILRTLHDYLAAERQLGRASGADDPHLVGISARGVFRNARPDRQRRCCEASFRCCLSGACNRTRSQETTREG
jgi:hypothetical protein